MFIMLCGSMNVCKVFMYEFGVDKVDMIGLTLKVTFVTTIWALDSNLDTKYECKNIWLYDLFIAFVKRAVYHKLSFLFKLYGAIL